MQINPYQSADVPTPGHSRSLAWLALYTVITAGALLVFGGAVAIYFYDKGWNDCLRSSGYSLDPNRDWVLP